MTPRLQVFVTRRNLAGARHTWRLYRVQGTNRIRGQVAIYHGAQRGNSVEVSNYDENAFWSEDRKAAAKRLRVLRSEYPRPDRTRTFIGN